MLRVYRPENFPLLEFRLGVELVKENVGGGEVLRQEYSVEVRVYDRAGSSGLTDYKFVAVTGDLDVGLIEGALARGVSPIDELFLGQGEFREGLLGKDNMLLAYYADIERRSMLSSAGLGVAGLDDCGSGGARSKSV